MPMYRKRPVVIEAQLLTRENFDAVGEWAGAEECWELAAPSPAIFIDTLEGRMRADLGDWVIKGVQGEFYPIKDSIFQETYGRSRRPRPGRVTVVRWPRRYARKDSAPNAAGSSPAAPSGPRKTPPPAGSSPSPRITGSSSPAVLPSACPGAAAASSPASGTDAR